jgi:hypothetical protein
LESGSIINRDEELVMASDEHKSKVSAAVAAAAADYCETRGPAPPLVAKPEPQISKPPPRKKMAQPHLRKPAQPQPRATRKR